MKISSTPGRPEWTPNLSGAEFLRWYWLKAELVDFARTLRIRTSGGKELLTQRIAAKLDGQVFAEPTVTQRSQGRQLSGQLCFDTVIPAGQRCSQVVRGWFVKQVGPSFRFDHPMREFFASTDGTQTLADALNHWHQTRNQDQKSVGAQFEYNRFTGAWYDEHPNGTKDELLSAWREYRSQPIDARGKA